MSTLRTNNLQNPDSGDVNLQLTQDGGAVFVGLVTTSSLNVNGNVTIGGTITYEDVTNIDSVGVITARSGIDVTGGVITSDDYTITGISSSISDTAVDVFIYDTSKDSDGGAWRKRTQHTSWYNETLNTATRGSRREFPAVAVLVLTNTNVIIYDGDDPDLPMWMDFTISFNNYAQGARMLGGVYGGSNQSLTTTAITMMNGQMWMSRLGAYNGSTLYGVVNFVDFLQDLGGALSSDVGNGVTVKNPTFLGNIAQRNLVDTFSSHGQYKYWSGGIVNSQCNDVAMTVLSSAPIDSATGLPIPTIAVATNGGLSVITDNGSIFDDTTSAGVSSAGIEGCAFSGTKVVYYRGGASGNKAYVQDVSSISADFTGQRMYRVSPFGETNEVSNVCHGLADIDEVEGSDDNLILGAEEGIAIINENLNSPTNGLVAKIASDYNTGWMPGDIKGAFLSDTDATNVTGSNLIDNGDFGTGDFTNWSVNGTTTPTISSGGALLTTGALDGAIWQSTSGEATSGKWIITWTVTSNSGGFFGIYLNNDGPNGSGGFLSLDSITTSGSHYYEGNITAVEFRHRGSSSGIIDNITLRRVEDDRSVNNKGLAVYGTITKSAVATGAELVAYHGVSATNYLQQPYNSDLNFGTGDFSIFVWVLKNTISSNHYIIDRAPAPFSSTGRAYFIINASGYHRFRLAGGSGTEVTGSVRAMTAGVYNHIGFVRKSGAMEFWMNGELVQTVTGSAASASFDNGVTGQILTVDRYANGFGSDYTFDRMSLLRISGSAPSAEQVKKMYEDEKVLFQENAACTLYGSSDAVTALAYDEVTDRLHVGTSSGRSDFQGLRRINNTTTAVTTAISAHDEFIVEQ